MTQNNLWTALRDARARMNPVIQDSTNPHYGNDFASLEAVYDCIDVALHESGLVVVQCVDFEGDVDFLQTIIAHTDTGDQVSARYPLRPAKTNDPQEFAGAVTYARRYSLVSMLGLKMADDDGNAASPPPQSLQNKPAPTPQEDTPKATPAQIVDAIITKLSSAADTEDKVKQLWIYAKEHLDGDDLKRVQTAVRQRMAELNG